MPESTIARCAPWPRRDMPGSQPAEYLIRNVYDMHCSTYEFTTPKQSDHGGFSLPVMFAAFGTL